METTTVSEKPKPTLNPQTNKMAFLSLIQGAYYFLTGVWPIIDMQSFMVITGPKTDLWLVQTVGMIIAVVGTALVTAGFKKQINLTVVVLGAGSAIGFILIEVYYVLMDVISVVYLGDAFLEGIFLLIWIGLIFKRKTIPELREVKTKPL